MYVLCLNFVIIKFYLNFILDSERLEKGNTRVPKLKTIDRGKVVDISHRLGTPKMPKPEWLIATPKNKLPHPERLAFPPSKKEGEFVWLMV